MPAARSLYSREMCRPWELGYSTRRAPSPPAQVYGGQGESEFLPPPVPDLLTSVLQPSTSGGHLRSQQTTGRIRAAQGMASTASHAATTVTSRGVGIDCPDAVWRAPVYDDTTISAIEPHLLLAAPNSSSILDARRLLPPRRSTPLSSNPRALDPPSQMSPS